MTLQKLASLIAKREGKRSQARVGDVREIIKILVGLIADGNEEQKYEGTAQACINEAVRKEEEKRAKKKARAK